MPSPTRPVPADGSKNFLRGGRVARCFFTLADKADGPLVLCEGYATGASIHEATGYAVLCAMNCGNLLSVAKAARELWPQREMIVAADNDQWTDGNPGQRKGTAAARAIRAKLGVPRFKDTATRPTDFNDLHIAEGLENVKHQIDAAAVPGESNTDTVQRLAALSRVEYDRCRETEAVALGIRKSTLDAEVEAHRPRVGIAAHGSTVEFPEVDPWEMPVRGSEVLNEVAARFSRHLALPPGGASALALWVGHTHAFEAFVHTPRLNFRSPEKGCGKTTALDVLASMTPRPLRTESMTAPVLFRLVEDYKPTLLLDEVDAYLSAAEELRGLLNAGHKRGAKAYRCEGENNTVRGFAAFAPAALAGIGALPGTLHDRAIVVTLVRSKPGEVAARFDSRHTEQEMELCRKLARWAADNFEKLKNCDPQLPETAFNRLADNWRPLFAVAELAGGDWPTRAVEAFAKLTSTEDLDAQGVGTTLLADIAAIFAREGTDKLPSNKLAEGLAGIEGRPWAEFGKHRKPISPNQLANQLRPFGVAPSTIRVGDETPRGYLRPDFQEAFERYLPKSRVPECNSATMLGDCREKAAPTMECCSVAVQQQWEAERVEPHRPLTHRERAILVRAGAENDPIIIGALNLFNGTVVS